MAYNGEEKKNIARRKQLRDERKEKGLCIDCGELALRGRIRCASCSYRDNLRVRKYKQTHREELRIKAIQERQGRTEENKCIRCGAPLKEDEANYCIWCRNHKQTPVLEVNV